MTVAGPNVPGIKPGIERRVADLQAITAARIGDLGNRAKALEDGRIPYILTCLSWQAIGRFIVFWANPRDLTWNYVLRGTTQRLKGGQISYVWRDSGRGSTFYDEPRLTITFQTGNCMPVRLAGGSAIRVPPGLIDLYEFLELMNEPLVLSDGTMNYRVIIHNSILFPFMALYGWFPPEQDFSIAESAEDPAQSTWSHTFLVRRSFPDFKNTVALIAMFQRIHGANFRGTGDIAAFAPGAGTADQGVDIITGASSSTTPSEEVNQNILAAEANEQAKQAAQTKTDNKNVGTGAEEDQLDPAKTQAVNELGEDAPSPWQQFIIDNKQEQSSSFGTK